VLSWVKRAFLPIALRPAAGGELVRLGSRYGGWWLPEAAVRPGAIAYCAGAGEDITFDLALCDKGLNVVTFDPTPRAIEYVREHGDGLQFEPVGWWDEPCELRFYAPTNVMHVSHSALNLQGTDSFFVAPVDTVANLARRLGHEQIDIVKMDIEGAEFRVVHSMLRDRITPTVLAVEFDIQSLRRIAAVAAKLRRVGYRVAKVDGWNVTFVHQ
jgi:FkbM family methyltransferase